jgi:hypothetical protein
MKPVMRAEAVLSRGTVEGELGTVRVLPVAVTATVRVRKRLTLLPRT